jgi:hypothetical protein
MTDRREGGLAILASLLVLFTAMLEPAVSAALAFLALAALGIWKLVGTPKA